MTLSKKMKFLLLVSSLCGFAAVFVFRRNLSAEASLVNYFGFLTDGIKRGTVSVYSVKELFKIPVVGLIYFNFFDSVNVLLVVILFIPAVYFCSLHSKVNSIISALLLFCCLGMYIASDMALPVYFNLHDIDKLRSVLGRESTYGHLRELSVFLLYTTGLFITISAKRYTIFGKFTFVVGLLTNVIGLLYFPSGLLLGEYRFIAIVLAAPFTVIWHFNIALNYLFFVKKRDHTIHAAFNC